MKKKSILFIILSFLGILLFNTNIVKADAINADFSVKINSTENTPEWTIIIDPNGNQYKEVTVNTTFSGNQCLISKSVKIEYGHMDNGKFVVENTDKNLNNEVFSGNKLHLNLKNVNQVVRITYATAPQKIGVLSSALTINADGQTVRKNAKCNILGLGYMDGKDAREAVGGVSGTSADDAVITDASGNVIDHDQDLNRYKSYNVSWNWSIPDESQIKAGDTIDFELPDNVEITSNITFNVTQGAGGPVIGSFTIKKGSNKGTLTFNNYLAEHPETNRHGIIEISANGKTDSDQTTTNWYLNKVGWVNQSGQPTWNVVVNPQEKHYDTITITDKMADGQEIIPDSIVIQYGHYDQNGEFIVDHEDSDPNNYTIDGNEIKFNFKDVDSAIQIVYNVKAEHSGILHNAVDADLTEDGKESHYTNSAEISYSGNGSMDGDSSSSSSSMVSSSTRSSSKSSSSNSSSLTSNSSSETPSSSMIQSSSKLLSSNASSLASSSSSEIPSSSIAQSNSESSSSNASSLASSSSSEIPSSSIAQSNSESSSSNASSLASSSSSEIPSSSMIQSSSKVLSSNASSLASSSSSEIPSSSMIQSSSKVLSSNSSSLASSNINAVPGSNSNSSSSLNHKQLSKSDDHNKENQKKLPQTGEQHVDLMIIGSVLLLIAMAFMYKYKTK